MIIVENGKNRYFDKNGKEIIKGSTVRYGDGRTEIVYETEDGELGVDATNPKWIANGRAFPCEYGIFPFNKAETEMVEVVAFLPMS